MTPLARLIAGCAAISLACCSPPSPQSGGGIGGTGSVATVAHGPVTKFGSVFISGNEYDNSNTIYCIDDEPCGPRNTLKIGMVVLVNGLVNEESTSSQTAIRSASTIFYEETVEGIVQSVAPDGSSLSILGQLIRVNQKTVIDPSVPGQSIRQLIPGMDRVEVSGFVTGDGEILATLLTKQTGTPHYEIQGSIKNHDGRAHTFEIGALVVEYSSAEISGMPAPGPGGWNGIIVHVRGEQLLGGPGPSRLTANRVKPLELGVQDVAKVEVEGVILQIAAPGNFTINNTRIRTNDSTVFDGGTAADLVAGVRVEVNGALTGGILQASRVSFDD